MGILRAASVTQSIECANPNTVANPSTNPIPNLVSNPKLQARILPIAE